MIELADVISELRAELERAKLAADGSALRFGLGPIELEVSVALAREGGVGGKIQFWVVEVNTEGKLASTSTQRIKLTLKPSLTATSESGGGDGTATSVYVGGKATPRER